jgi:hypothetical protein
MGGPFNTVQADMPPPDGSMPVPPGELVRYYSDIASGAISPEDMRIENLKFEVRIDPAGNISFESDKISLISRYSFAISKVVGFAMDPDFAGIAAYLVGVQVREEGRNFEIFKRPISMASLLSPVEGAAAWRGTYITIPGTDVGASWSVDTQRWAALVGATKSFGIQLLGDYVACAPLR